MSDGVGAAAAEWSFAHEECVGERGNDAIALNCEGRRELSMGRELRDNEGVVWGDVGFVRGSGGEGEDAGGENKSGSAACAEGTVVCCGVYAASMATHDGKASACQSSSVAGDHVYTALRWMSRSDNGKCRLVQDAEIALKIEDWWCREAKAKAEFAWVGFVGNGECEDAACFELAQELLCGFDEVAPVIECSVSKIRKGKFAAAYEGIKVEEALNRVAADAQGFEKSIERSWSKALYAGEQEDVGISERHEADLS